MVEGESQQNAETNRVAVMKNNIQQTTNFGKIFPGVAPVTG
jgi:cytochrome c556